MRVLLIKTSSMGDIIHTLPALTDASYAIPNITFDWVVEDTFAEIPVWHPQVNRVIPVSLRRWRKGIFSKETRFGWRQLREQLKEEQYDLILDAQGLVKSAFLLFFAKGKRAGLDWNSARESLASLVYHHKYKVNFYQHAVIRMRSLFSLALNYKLPITLPDFGLEKKQFQKHVKNENYIVFLYGTTWKSKKWPESYWSELAEIAGKSGYRIKLSGHHSEEIAEGSRIASKSNVFDVLPRLTISEMANLLAHASAVVAVDTGLGHLAAAFDLPTVTIYGATNPDYTSAVGRFSIPLKANFPCSPCLNRKCRYKGPTLVTPACYDTVDPKRVWKALERMLVGTTPHPPLHPSPAASRRPLPQGER